jgi:hypothetical protein
MSAKAGKFSRIPGACQEIWNQKSMFARIIVPDSKTHEFTPAQASGVQENNPQTISLAAQRSA